jgi:hypothetical protein
MIFAEQLRLLIDGGEAMQSEGRKDATIAIIG